MSASPQEGGLFVVNEHTKQRELYLEELEVYFCRELTAEDAV